MPILPKNSFVICDDVMRITKEAHQLIAGDLKDGKLHGLKVELAEPEARQHLATQARAKTG
jgi:hypothetical protein